MTRGIVVVIALCGCGRIAFDELTDDESPTVTGGTFKRSHDTADDMFPFVDNPATLTSYRLDKFEVTVERFRQFVAAGQGTQLGPPPDGAGAHANIPGSGWNASWNASLAADTTALNALLECNAVYQTWTDEPGGNESRPMNCVSWYEAMAFCAWDGGYLPTEAEWNYAASGGDLQRAYPWSKPATSLAIDTTRASYYVDDTSQCFGDGVDGCALTDLVEVGTKPAGDGRWGHADLAGNVWEWALDWYGTYPNPCTDCANVTLGTGRVLRGAGFGYMPMHLRASNRYTELPAFRGVDVGLRCARAF